MGLWVSLFLTACENSQSDKDASVRIDSGISDSDSNSDTGYYLNCDEVPWTYDNVGAPFMSTWCTSCHSSGLEEGYRAGAPLHVNLDTQADVQQWASVILHRLYNEATPMPPIVEVPDDDKLRAAEWLYCGAL